MVFALSYAVAMLLDQAEWPTWFNPRRQHLPKNMLTDVTKAALAAFRPELT